MNASRIRMSHQYGETTPANIFPDFDWSRRHEKELLEKYGECSVIVYQEQVIGVGATYDEAVADAERNLPADSGEITPIHRRIYHRHPFFRVRPKSVEDDSSR